MADLEARRNARRRKILENSEKRLSRITGSINKEELGNEKIILDNSIKTSSHSDLSDQHTIFNELNADFISAAQSKNDLNEPLELDDDYTVPTDDTPHTSNLLLQSDNHASNQANYKNIYICCLGLFQALVFMLSDILPVNFWHPEYIFLPLIALETAHYFFITSDSSLTYVDSVLALYNVRSKFLKMFLNVLKYFFQIMQDVMLYFFTFVVIIKLLGGLSKVWSF